MAQYQEIVDPRLLARTRARYEREIGSLEQLGFRYLISCLESLGPFSAILQLPVFLLTLPKKEVLVFPWPFRFAVANVLLYHMEPPCIALCMGMGVKLYSTFSDGSLLISSTFQSYAIPKPDSRIVKIHPALNIDELWTAHRGAVRSLETSRGNVRKGLDFEDYVTLSHQEEELSQYQ